MKKQILLNLLLFGLFAPLSIQAQTLTKDENQSIENILNSYTKGVQTGKIKVDSTKSVNDTLTVFATKNFSYVPFRIDNYSSLTQKLKDSLSAQHSFKSIPYYIR
ncbi:MAG: hypothetical protein LKI18_01395 [Prevotella sp.]|jgi:N-acetylglutamate synthase/N-acetylornithine aminotransferase|nr:hypothetical protein [Prevotella sp.]